MEEKSVAKKNMIEKTPKKCCNKEKQKKVFVKRRKQQESISKIVEKKFW